jgi:polyhydroxyalkanoate synthesis regulator phasin
MQREAEYYALQLAQTMRRSEDASLAGRIIEAVKAMFSPHRAERNPATNEADMTVSKEQFDALAEKVTALEAGIGETVKNAITEAMAPVRNKLDTIEAAEKAKTDAEKAELVNRLVATGKLAEDEASALDLTALRVMANALAPKAVAPMNKAANAGKADAFDWAANLPKEA